MTRLPVAGYERAGASYSVRGPVPLLAHGTPQVASILTSEVSTIPGEVQSSRRGVHHSGGSPPPPSAADGLLEDHLPTRPHVSSTFSLRFAVADPYGYPISY